MKVLILGADGQLGRALTQTAPPGWYVDALARQDVDITDGDALAHAISRFDPEAIVNAAAYTAVDLAEEQQGLAEAVNASAPARLARLCATQGRRLVHFSTDFVFDGALSRPYRPDAVTNPLNVYGRTKLAGEVATLCTVDALVIRTSWVYAAVGRNFVQTMLSLMAAGKPLRVVADQIGVPTHATSLARATWILLQGGTSGLHHFTDAGVASWYDFAVAIQEEAILAGKLTEPVPIAPIPASAYLTAAKRPAYSVLDATTTWALLPTPPDHWRVELRAMFNAMKDHAHV